MSSLESDGADTGFTKWNDGTHKSKVVAWLPIVTFHSFQSVPVFHICPMVTSVTSTLGS